MQCACAANCFVRLWGMCLRALSGSALQARSQLTLTILSPSSFVYNSYALLRPFRGPHASCSVVRLLSRARVRAPVTRHNGDALGVA